MSGSDPSQLLVDRAALLRQLDSEPKDTEELQTAVGLSSSTINRTVCKLEKTGYVEQVDDQYQTTLTGRLALKSYEQFTTTMDTINKSTDLLGALGSDAQLAPAVLADAEVLRTTRDSARVPIDRSAALLSEAEQVRTVLSTISTPYLNLYYEQVVDGTNVSIVVSPSLIEQLVTEYYDPLTEVISTGRIELRQATEETSFGLTIVESASHTAVELRVYGSDGLRGVIINDSHEAITWANTYFENEWNDALPMQTL